jgi:hypothetical protein
MVPTPSGVQDANAEFSFWSCPSLGGMLGLSHEGRPWAREVLSEIREGRPVQFSCRILLREGVRMGAQPENAEIFSMCNCITLGMPRTYTAHAMTMDMFLRLASPGARIPRPYIDLWPKTFIKIYKIPENVKVFVFSTFNEVYLGSHVFEDGVRCTMGFNEKYEPLKRLSCPIPRLEIGEFCEYISRVGEKVLRDWGQKTKRIILRYDKTRATPEIRDRMNAYDEAVIKTTGWPVVQVKDPKGPIPVKGRPHMWCHYGKPSLRDLYLDIVKIERS